jgi:hypothetical protein
MVTEAIDDAQVEPEDMLRADTDAQLAALASVACDLDRLECASSVRQPAPPL